MTQNILVGIVSSVLTAMVIFIGGQALGLFTHEVDRTMASQVGRTLLEDPDLSRILLEQIEIRVEADLPDWGTFATEVELAAAIGSLALDTRYFGPTNQQQTIRDDLHDDCRSGYVYIGPNRPDEHGGFCVGLISN